MWRMLEALGNPQWAVPAIHVAGTNGKGSVCAMLEVALRKAGFKTGLFTSPHLIYQGERIQVNRTILSEQEIIGYTIELRDLADRIFPKEDPVGYLSFFEFMTVMAFLHFQRAGVEISLIETGLGGRLDSTNVLKPLVCAVTSIGLDHMEVLGSEITTIAEEKAGIFHPGVPAVIGPMIPEVNAVFQRFARELGVPLLEVAELYGPGKETLPQSALLGDHQRWNSAVAETVLRQLPAPLSRACAGARDAFLEVDWAGRWQKLEGGNLPVWMDAAHNEAGVRQLSKLLEEHNQASGGEWSFVMGATGLDRARAFAGLARNHAKEIYLIEPDHPRTTTFQEWDSLLKEVGFTGNVYQATAGQLFPKPRLCTLENQAEKVLVTGSLYLIGEVLDRWSNDPPVAQTWLQDR